MTKENNDIIRQLKELAFATRLKRLSEQLGRDVSRLYAVSDLEFEARWFPVYYALYNQMTMSVTELARTLGLTHPAINQLTAQMARRDLVESSADGDDDRRRMLRLTTKARKMHNKLNLLWQDIGKATKGLIDESGVDLMEALTVIEESLKERDMFQRVVKRENRKIEILPYRPAFKKHFKRLNEEWLEKHFEILPSDLIVLNDPNGKIIKQGGQILFASLDDEIVGTCALIKHSDKIYELAKMAVTPAAQGFGCGMKLANKIIQLASKFGADQLFLMTSPELISAMKLYRKLGFVIDNKSSLPGDSCGRCTKTMKLKLK